MGKEQSFRVEKCFLELELKNCIYLKRSEKL